MEEEAIKTGHAEKAIKTTHGPPGSEPRERTQAARDNYKEEKGKSQAI